MTPTQLYKLMFKVALICLFIAWAITVFWNGGPPYFHFSPIAARVIDAETKEPIEGVIITANWELVTDGFHGTLRKGQLKVTETVTDHDGRFYFPGFIRPNLFGYEIRTSDPDIVIFKPGYRFISLGNPDYSAHHNRNPKRISPIDGKTFELRRFPGNEKEYARELDRLGNSLRFATNGDACEWWNIPRMIVATDRLNTEYEKLGIATGLTSIRAVSQNNRCGFPTEYFAPYMKP